MAYQAEKSAPMSLVFLGTIRRSSRTILMASRRISMMLLMRASRGARGNAATNMVVKLNCITENVREWHGHFICFTEKLKEFPKLFARERQNRHSRVVWWNFMVKWNKKTKVYTNRSVKNERRTHFQLVKDRQRKIMYPKRRGEEGASMDLPISMNSLNRLKASVSARW